MTKKLFDNLQLYWTTSHADTQQAEFFGYEFYIENKYSSLFYKRVDMIELRLLHSLNMPLDKEKDVELKKILNVFLNDRLLMNYGRSKCPR